MHRVSVQTEDFDVKLELEKLREGRVDVGAVVSFIGLVRDMVSSDPSGRDIVALELEHYPGMTEKALGEIVEKSQQRWQLQAVTVIHRIGQLTVGEQIVLVAVASTHRGEAFAACEFIMDYLKTQAPFWKKEYTSQGAHWVDARESDDVALKKWERIN